MIEISPEVAAQYMATAKQLKGSERRMFMARIIQQLGRGGQRYAEAHFGWNRRTLRKGMQELTSGIPQVDRFAARGRKRAEARLPNLFTDLQTLSEQVDNCSSSLLAQAREVRRRLIDEKGYRTEELPAVVTIAKRLQEIRSNETPAQASSSRRAL